MLNGVINGLVPRTTFTHAHTPVHIQTSNSSDSDYSAPHQSFKMANQSKFALVKQDAPSKVPMLLPGDITPKVMHEYQDACVGYFEHKEIAEDKQVRKILAGLKDNRVKEWLSVDHNCIQALNFTAFMLELHVAYLPEDWE